MRIAILNGNPDMENRGFDGYLARLGEVLAAEQHQVTALTLREMDIRYCVGCFGCWVKTPGQCGTADDSHQVGRAVINSDFTLWAAPLRMGFPSALLKKTLDKTIPLIHPYFVVDQNEAHHRARYPHYPLLGLLLEREPDTDDEDVRIVGDVLSRTALNMKSRLSFVAFTGQPVEEVARAIADGANSQVAYARDLAPIPGVRVTPPTRLTAFNGSPRGPQGNTPLMLEQFLKGFAANEGRSTELFHLNRLGDLERHREAFAAAESVLLGFPLYTDAMPGIVKAFIEALEPLRGRAGNPPLGFLVQSGFAEAIHSRHVERYLAKLAARLGCPYLGTLVKGGGGSTRSMPENMTRRLFTSLSEIGRTFGAAGQFDPAMLRALARPEHYPVIQMPLLKLIYGLLVNPLYWDSQLKANGVYDQRFARPFSDV